MGDRRAGGGGERSDLPAAADDDRAHAFLKSGYMQRGGGPNPGKTRFRAIERSRDRAQIRASE